ncbi:hypothetical protein OBBRIDRAFT_728372 [Obba rivulosa]|uniref:Apoptosis inhibitor 5 n=1 Tax=Obba rivulosa TaxID=1052685 RepID=A0A8E2AYX6_9APHY|nr:hypothetical protein OBBRIDRAFT_728372 [Obba rivulosa]
MESRSLAEQERDVKELLRRAERTQLKDASARKDALKRLIDLAHSPHASLKIIAATNFKHFVKDFPELEDDAINAVYDLCEDQSSQVRIKGYAAIVEVSQAQHKWVKRNADVLVQLLQSDEPEEVTFVKRALTQHLDMDPAVTLGVLCDQIVPPDELMDEEEQAIRDRLRSLVLSFVTGEAKRAIIERHTSTLGSPAEEVLVNGLFKAITKLTQIDVNIIVREILISLSTFKPHSPRTTQLLDIVLDRAKEALKVDLPPGSERSSLDYSRPFLDLASFIAIDRRLTSSSPLLRLYHQQLMPKLTLLRLVEDARIFVISNVAKTLAALEEASPAEASVSSEDLQLRRHSPDMCVALLQLFSEPSLGDSRPWSACRILLDVCVRVRDISLLSSPPHP